MIVFFRYLFTIVLIAIIVGYVVMIMYWFTEGQNDFTKIKYKTFRKYYKLYPDRWRCYTTFVDYSSPNGLYEETFGFGFISLYRYQLWRYSIKRAKERKEQKESMQLFLDNINHTEVKND